MLWRERSVTSGSSTGVRTISGRKLGRAPRARQGRPVVVLAAAVS